MDEAKWFQSIRSRAQNFAVDQTFFQFKVSVHSCSEKFDKQYA